MLPLPNGRAGAQLLMTQTRALTPGDLLILATTQKSGEKRHNPAPSLQVLRATHHQAARLIARGLTYAQVATEVGRTAQRISDLMRDPTFKELVTYYETQLEELTTDDSIEFTGIVKDIARLSAEEIQDRLSDDTKRAQIPIGELRQLMGDALTRTVLPPKTAVPVTAAPVKITFNMGNRDLRFHQGNNSDTTDVIEADAETLETQTSKSSSNGTRDVLLPHNALPRPREEG